MKNIKFTIIISLFFLISNNYSLYAQSNYKVDKVVIDAGHGGKDSGAVGKNSKEKEIALAIALKVGKLIETNLKDVKTIYTRDKDVFVELYKRADIANKAKADLFISIHCNAVKSSRAKGTETWIMGVSRSAKNLAVAKKENAAILLEADYSKNYDNFNPNSTESYIMFELLQNAYREQSMQLANAVQWQFKNRIHRIDRSVKEAGFLVLVYTAMPSILIETGFISNPDEEKFLLSEQGQDYMASAIYRAFRDYKVSMEQGKSTVNNTLDTSKTDNTIIKKEDSVQQKTKAKEKAYFGVQFTTSVKEKDINNAFPDIADVWSYKQGDLNKYVSGKFDNFKDAKRAMKKIRKGIFKDAFVVAFINDKRVSRKEAETKIKELK